MNRAEIKAMAKEQIKGNIAILFVIMLIVGVISSLLGVIPVVGAIASALIVPALSLSVNRIYLNLAKGTKPTVNDTFSGIDDFWSAFKVNFFSGLFITLWLFLLIIPGIVKALSYSMAPFILAENKGKPALECINESKAMMNGHKMELFVLYLSFIGWGLLCAITFGIASIWVTPYMSATVVNFYNKIKPVTAEPEEAAEAAETAETAETAEA